VQAIAGPILAAQCHNSVSGGITVPHEPEQDDSDVRSRTLAELSWRMRPGILGKHSSSQQSVHTLLGYFLSDRDSPTPFPGRDVLIDQHLFQWGIAPPLEKVISSGRELDILMGLPEIYRNSVSVIEPWKNVGINLQGEAVRASKNIAYILQQVADADTILFPVWQSGAHNPRHLAQVMSSGIATVVQGGDPSVHDPTSFNGSASGLEDILTIVEELLMCRSPSSGPSIFICLGHQLAAAAYVRLIKRATREVESLVELPLDRDAQGLQSLQRVCRRIAVIGETLPVIKDGKTVAEGWEDSHFAVARNEQFEIGTRRLVPYQRRSHSSNHIPGEFHDAHALIADELEGVIDTMLKTERDVNIEMFHGDEVNEEAALFANWAFKLLHDTIVPIRHSIAVSPVSWLLCLPYALEILSQTKVDESTWTEVSTTCIYYKDWETHSIRRSFTCQFHPELMADIRDIGGREAPRYAELKDNDGVRMLVRLLYHGMQE
jgi:GMP synthase-like glutamine amidotransferase